MEAQEPIEYIENLQPIEFADKAQLVPYTGDKVNDIEAAEVNTFRDRINALILRTDHLKQVVAELPTDGTSIELGPLTQQLTTLSGELDALQSKVEDLEGGTWFDLADFEGNGETEADKFRIHTAWKTKINDTATSLQALQTAIGNGEVDAGTVVSQLTEILTVFENYQEGFNLAAELQRLSGAVQTAQSTAAGKQAAGDYATNAQSIAFTSALNFTSDKKLNDYTQTGNIAFTLASAAHKPGATIAAKITGNGSGSVSFSNDFVMMGKPFKNTEVNRMMFLYYGPNEVWVTNWYEEEPVVEEPTGVNLLANSEEFNASPYSKGAALAISDYAETDPAGGSNAQTLTVTSAEFWNGRLLLNGGIPVTSGQQYTLSLYVKADTTNQISLYLLSGANTKGRGSFNLSTDVTNNLIGNTLAIEAAPNGFKRLSLTFTPDVSGNLDFFTDMDGVTAVGQNLHIFGLQLNPGATADTYTKKP